MDIWLGQAPGGLAQRSDRHGVPETAAESETGDPEGAEGEKTDLEMRYLSVFSGVEAATMAWAPLGWQAVAFAEIEKFPSAVLKHHYPDVSGDVTHPCGRNNGLETCIAFTERGRKEGRTLEYQEDVAYALTNPGSGGRTHSRQILARSAVRRLTPRECERLQGFPDDYTALKDYNTWRDVDANESPEDLRSEGYRVRQTKKGKWRVNDPDGPRYRAIGNSMAVPVMRWIGERIQAVEALYER